MMKYLILPMLVLIISCSPKTGAQRDSQDAPALSFDLDSLIQEKCVGEECAKLRLVWPVASGPELSSQINETIAQEITEMMMFGESNSLVRDSLIAQYFQSYLEYKDEFPSGYGAWEVDVVGKVTYQSDNTLSISVDWMNYLGGAHPNSGQDFLNFELSTGKFLSREQLVKDEKKLLALAEQKFREFHEVEKGMTLEEDGRFFLPETGFFLANSMGFEEDKFKIIYIPYEIGPYAMGYTELEFTREELGDLVRW